MNLARRGCQLLLVTALLLSGCAGSESNDPRTDTTDRTRTVQTLNGPVEVPASPQRIVVLNYALVGYLFNLDQPVIATVREDVDMPEGEFSEFWADKAQSAGTKYLPWTSDGYNVEAILAEEPDVILAGGIGFPFGQAQKAYDQLAAIAPTVIVDSTLDTWQQQLRFLAVDVFDRPERYAELEQAYDKRIAEVADTITEPEMPTGVLVMTADERPFGLMRKAGTMEVLDQVGLQPAAVAEEKGLEPYTAGGDMFESSPELVSTTFDQPTLLVMGFNGDVTSVQQLAQNELYAQLPSFASNRAYDLDYWMLRGDYDETMALLDRLADLFG